MNFIGIIPARFASTRFPGKPLVNINGKPMIQRVYEQASKSLKTVVVATDDQRIKNAVLNFGGQVVMTSSQHRSGTDRCAEAVELASQMFKEKFDVVVNIQGDEPFIQPEQIKLLMSIFADKTTQIATLVKKISKSVDIFNPNNPKVIFNSQKEAIYFSRSTIPYCQNVEKDDWLKHHQFYKHIGLYAYKYDVLKAITTLPQSLLEIAESLEQNRWIENAYKIKVEITDYESISIDTPKDLEEVLGSPD
jgi:3-deoxy-manno-octulosonate cytidylyltransferase (CMP-KDO synthetase)